VLLEDYLHESEGESKMKSESESESESGSESGRDIVYASVSKRQKGER